MAARHSTTRCHGLVARETIPRRAGCHAHYSPPKQSRKAGVRSILGRRHCGPTCPAVFETWRREYNAERPANALGGLVPETYAKTVVGSDAPTPRTSRPLLKGGCRIAEGRRRHRNSCTARPSVRNMDAPSRRPTDRGLLAKPGPASRSIRPASASSAKRSRRSWSPSDPPP